MNYDVFSLSASTKQRNFFNLIPSSQSSFCLFLYSAPSLFCSCRTGSNRARTGRAGGPRAGTGLETVQNGPLGPALGPRPARPIS